MRVTYLAHSGFCVATDDVVMVFDMYRDPAHALHRVLHDNPGVPVIFFVTHNHKDHFSPDIYEVAQDRKRFYVISNDVPAKEIPSTLNVAGMSPGDYIEGVAGVVSVKAYPSTDAGVSYLVTDKNGRTVFHAGDLNDWHWENESTAQEVQREHAKFQTVVNRIAEEHPAINVAFFPVDVRLGDDYAAGARYFLEKINVADFFPMHFNGDYAKACAFAVYAPERTMCHCLRSPGESISLKNK